MLYWYTAICFACLSAFMIKEMSKKYSTWDKYVPLGSVCGLFFPIVLAVLVCAAIVSALADYDDAKNTKEST